MTNPESPPSRDLLKPQAGSFDYKENVEDALIHLGIPFEKARVAVIDLKSDVYRGQRNTLTPLQTAVSIIDKVRRIYKCTL